MPSPVSNKDCSIMAMHGSVSSNSDDYDEILLVPGGTPADVSLYRERISRFLSEALPWTAFSIMSGNSDYVTQNKENDALAWIKAMLIDFDCALGKGQNFVVEGREIMGN